jgi:hypothetical protein
MREKGNTNILLNKKFGIFFIQLFVDLKNLKGLI